MRADEHPDRNCAHGHPEDWFPPRDNIHEGRLAKALCNGCPVIDLCLEEALKAEWGSPTSARYGIYGGHTPAERSAIERHRRTNEPIRGPGRQRQPIRHGTEGGHKTHLRRGEEPCTACRAAAALARRRREGAA